jgi:site-specific DNA recombinase
VSTTEPNPPGPGADPRAGWRPAVLYAAKSTADLKLSIPTQLADGQALAEAGGLEVMGRWSDEAASAFHGNRGPGLSQAMAECERLAAEHGTCALIVQHSDRLARGDARQARHLIEIVLWAIKHGVDLLSAQDPEILAGGDYGLLMGAVGGMRNHQDSKRKGLAVKDGLRRRVTECRQFVGGRRPYGYEWVPERGPDGQLVERRGRLVKRLEPVPAEAAVVRRIFAEYLRGVAQNRIARDLMTDGVPTLTPGGSWYATTVAGMLRNPLYVGRVVLGGEDHPGDHEPIIDPNTWERACQLRAGRHAHGVPRGRRTAGRHTLTEGLLRCRCGAAMSPVTKRDRRAANRKDYESYCCVKRLHHGPDACSQPPVKREAVDSALWAYFTDVALDLDATRRLLTEQAAESLGRSTHGVEQAEAELAKAEARLRRIKRGWQDEVLDDAEYAAQRAELEAELHAARAQAGQHQRKREMIEAAVARFDAEAAMLEELARLRQAVVGEVQNAGREGVEALRVALRSLFAGFQLLPTGDFGSAPPLRGTVWQGENVPQLGDYVLLPYLHDRAVVWDAPEWPALHPVGVALRSNLCARLPEHRLPLSLFGPIPLMVDLAGAGR